MRLGENADESGERPTARNGALSLGVASTRKSLKSIVQEQPVETHRAGKAIFCEGDEAVDIFLVASGQLVFSKMLPDGRRAVTGFALPDEFVALSSHGRFRVSAEAATTLGLQRLSRRRLSAMAIHRPSLLGEIAALVSDDLRRAEAHISLLSRFSAEERLASFLLDMYRRSAAHDDIVLPTRRSDIADYLGLTTETVSRMFANLKRKGLISHVSSKGASVKLEEIGALSKLALVDSCLGPDGV